MRKERFSVEFLGRTRIQRMTEHSFIINNFGNPTNLNVAPSSSQNKLPRNDSDSHGQIGLTSPLYGTFSNDDLSNMSEEEIPEGISNVRIKKSKYDRDRYELNSPLVSYCVHCKTCFASKGEFWQHIRDFNGCSYSTINRIYKCVICNKNFSQKGNLLRHEQTHTGKKPFRCELCGQRFTQKSNLQKHLATHNGEKNFVCGVCDRSFVQKANLIRHLRTHTGEKPFECEVCGHKFSQKSNLNKHNSLHVDKQSYVCDVCGVTFGTVVERRKHKSVVHHTAETFNVSGPEYTCDECPAKFRTNLTLQRHKTYHQ